MKCKTKPFVGQEEPRGIPSEQAFITVSCTLCGKVLFRGTRQQAKGLIIYCVDCPKDRS